MTKINRLIRTHVLVAGFLSAFASGPLLPCSTSAPQYPLLLGADGLVHWQLSDWRIDQPFAYLDSPSHYWLSPSTTLAAEPKVLQLKAPALIEGRSRLLGVLPDGSSWWEAWCDEGYPPETAACTSWILMDTNGAPKGRVSSIPYRHLQSQADGTLKAYKIEFPTRSLPRLRSWIGTPQPFTALDQPADNSNWDADYRKREAKRSRDGWSAGFDVAFPFPYRESYDRNAWAISADGRLLAAATSTRAGVQAGVFEIEEQDGKVALKEKWNKTFPKAANGQATTLAGEVALANPWFFVVSKQGHIAMSNWEHHADCSRDRPRGWMILGDGGQVLADVRTEGQVSVEGIAFNAQDQPVVARKRLGTHRLDGSLLSETDLVPNGWDQRATRLAERISALNDQSPLREWIELYPLIGEFDLPINTRDLEERAREKFVEAWPTSASLLPDALWWELSTELCQAHPDAAAATWSRFNAAHGERKSQWLKVLPNCFKEAPEGAIELADSYRQYKHTDRAQIAQDVLARWPIAPSELDGFWAEVIAAEASSDFRVKHQAQDARGKLVRLLKDQPEMFEEKLGGSRNERNAAAHIVFASLSGHIPGLTWEQQSELSSSIPAVASKWARSPREHLIAVGGLLLLGTNQWPGMGNASISEASDDLPQIKHVLSTALDGSSEGKTGRNPYCARVRGHFGLPAVATKMP